MMNGVCCIPVLVINCSVEELDKEW